MFAYKKAFECGNVKYESGKTHFDLNFDVEPFLAIGNVFEIEEQYDKAMAFYNKAIKQKDNFQISESTTVMFENQLDSPFGGTNLHLPDGEALACHVHDDALAS